MIRVVVVDDQALVRMGLRTLLDSEDDTELVGEAADGRAGVELIRRTRPDVVLMDIRMPLLDGLVALREITSDPALAGVRIVMLTTFELDEYVFGALRNGASGFVLKDSPPDELLHAVRVVADGASLLSPSVTRRVIQQFSRRGTPSSTPHPELERFTDREREIVAWCHRPLQRRNRRRAGCQPGNGAHSREPCDGEAPRPRPCPTGRLRRPIRPYVAGTRLRVT